MPGHRIERANSFIQQELTLLLRKAIRDPRVAVVTITGVSMTPDRRVARVYVASYEGEEVLQEGLRGLESAKSFLRTKLGQSLHWHFTPALEFRVDRSWDYGQKIDRLLERIDAERDTRPETEIASDDADTDL